MFCLLCRIHFMLPQGLYHVYYCWIFYWDKVINHFLDDTNKFYIPDKEGINTARNEQPGKKRCQSGVPKRYLLKMSLGFQKMSSFEAFSILAIFCRFQSILIQIFIFYYICMEAIFANFKFSLLTYFVISPPTLIIRKRFGIKGINYASLTHFSNFRLLKCRFLNFSKCDSSALCTTKHNKIWLLLFHLSVYFHRSTLWSV